MKKNATTTDTPLINKLFLAIELSKKQWKLCFGNGQKFRFKSVCALDFKALAAEIELCLKKFNLPADTVIYSCYEAGRDGFFLDRFLKSRGIENRVFDSSSIEVTRRSKQTKTDTVDVKKLLQLLIRMVLHNEDKVCAVVRVPTLEVETQMRIGRERKQLVKEQGAHRARIRSIVRLHGIQLGGLGRLEATNLCDYRGQRLPQTVIDEIQREQQRMKLVGEQIKQLENQQNSEVEQAEAPTQMAAQAAQLIKLYGIGIQTAWTLSHEFFWRDFHNRREVGACAGLCGCPYDSGESRREQGISKAGSKRVRSCCIEMAWNWVRFQPQSRLTQWFRERFDGSRRTRRVGIVALARKLLIAMWKYLKSGEFEDPMVRMKIA